MKTAGLIFPHQLFADHPVLEAKPDCILLIEDSLFFSDSQYPAKYHKQKLAYHRATIQAFEARLQSNSVPVSIVRWSSSDSAMQNILKELSADGFQNIVYCELADFSLERRLTQATTVAGIACTELRTPGFLNTDDENQAWRADRKRWAMADFYQWQRTRKDILMQEGKPEGGQWSYDEDNRKKLPIKALPNLPALPVISTTPLIESAIASISDQFKDNPGNLAAIHFPITHEQASDWLDVFCRERLENFGAYEDAIEEDQNWLYHSVLTPMLNVGLLTPQQILTAALKTCESQNIPLNSIEGFVRQILGWREFMRATYVDLGVQMRTGNHWEHHREMPLAFYDGSTGILPVDNAIDRLLDTGYCHHIERLMVLGGFMFLCEIKPDAVYKWFMEMFVDSYDWVMVPNVYAMSQHADGGLITTKPYFSGSNYVIKMSHYKKGEWSEIWDALFWRWIFKNKDKLAGNFRWAMMCKNADKMAPEKRDNHLAVAERYLSQLK